VSHVINNTKAVKDETRRRVELAFEQSGYSPDSTARRLALRKSPGQAAASSENIDTPESFSYKGLPFFSI
jgi:DNA-binding LacI/PurR family transcriptional regulator